jgi:hypothetical protein
MTNHASSLIDGFIRRWLNREGGQERANYSLFLTELCDVLGVAHPDPAEASHELNDYVFERRVEKPMPDGTMEVGRIDLYRRDCFILEAKQSKKRVARRLSNVSQGDLFSAVPGDTPKYSSSLDHLMIQARRQAERYATVLPSDHAYPPFLIVCDVGRTLELYADFSGHGRHYAQFPDVHSFRIELDHLSDPEIRQRLRDVWENPRSLDPAQQTAKVTREIAEQLATLSKALEGRGFEARSVAVFLMRCLFTMFVEDVGLLRKRGFTEILDRCLEDPRRFTSEIDDLWRHMDRGGYSPGIGEKLLKFNGKLFKNALALPLVTEEIQLLRDASAADWRDLEPAIFGTLFEQALDPVERKRLGAHYTPRAYVERLVDATIIEPLAKDWGDYQVAADQALHHGTKAEAINEIRDFLLHLSKVRVLDPACGTGNFLYVALRRMKQLEGEALKQLHDIGGEDAVADAEGLSVRPEQFYGMEINRRAVEIAELVLWIGYIQWHLKTRATPPPEPVLRSADHVHEKDALLTWDGYPEKTLKRDRLGRPVATLLGEEVYLYANAISPEWPPADFIVGNPPFMGGKDIRSRLGVDYAETLWSAHPQMNPSADFVMYWWDHAASLLTRENTSLRRFGFVTTNSITQTFQRRVLERHLNASSPISLLLAIPDHPWTRMSKDAAAVRIAMTVAAAGQFDGTVRTVIHEEALDSDEPKIILADKTGKINPDLTIGADVTQSKELVANQALCSPGVKLHGDGFIVTRGKALELGLGRRPGLENYIKEYRNGRDLTSRCRDVLVIDLFGVPEEQVRKDFPEIYQHLIETVRRQRMASFEKSPTRDAREYLDRWWLFGKLRNELRPALRGLSRYIVTVETMRHRVFQFVGDEVLPDNKLVVLALNSGFALGVVSSKIHVVWATYSGGWLGVGNDSVYVKSRCFDPFPFPEATVVLKNKIASIAEELDQTRKIVLAEHPDLTLTALYNVLAAIRSGVPMSAKEQDVQNRGRVLILNELHDQLDDLVFEAYGWPKGMVDEEIIQRLVDLNRSRAGEERRGFIRWLRPEYQIGKIGPLAHRADRVQSIDIGSKPKSKAIFPETRKGQVESLRALLEDSGEALTADQIANCFKGGNRIKPLIVDVLTSLSDFGLVGVLGDGEYYFRIAS